MIFKPKSVLSKMVLPCLSIALSLSLTPAHAMEEAMNDFLPNDALRSTFKQLPTKDLGRCELVCKRWEKVLLSADDLWEEAARRYAEGGKIFSLKSYCSSFPDPWKEILKETYLYDMKQKKWKHYEEVCLAAVGRENERLRLKYEGKYKEEFHGGCFAKMDRESISLYEGKSGISLLESTLYYNTHFSFEDIKEAKRIKKNRWVSFFKPLCLEPLRCERKPFDLEPLRCALKPFDPNQSLIRITEGEPFDLEQELEETRNRIRLLMEDLKIEKYEPIEFEPVQLQLSFFDPNQFLIKLTEEEEVQIKIKNEQEEKK